MNKQNITISVLCKTKYKRFLLCVQSTKSRDSVLPILKTKQNKLFWGTKPTHKFVHYNKVRNSGSWVVP